MFARGPQAVLPALRCCHLGLSVRELLRNHVNSPLKWGFTEGSVHLCFFNKVPAALSQLNYLTHWMQNSSTGGASVGLWAFLLPGSLENSKESLHPLGADTILPKEWGGIISTSRGSLQSGVRGCWGSMAFSRDPSLEVNPEMSLAWIAWHSCLG